MIRSLYLKVFLCFCFVSIVVRMIFVITVALHSRSLDHPWLTGALNSYARSALDVYLQDGKPGLARYLDEIEESSRVHATLLDPESRDILERGVPPEAQDVLEEAQSQGHSRFRIGARWRGASVISTNEGIIFSWLRSSHPVVQLCARVSSDGPLFSSAGCFA